MTKTAVDFTLGTQKIANERDLELAKQALTKQLEEQKINISRDELDQLIKHQNATDYLELLGKYRINKNTYNALADGFKTILQYTIPDANTALSTAGKMFNDISWHNKLTTAFDFATSLPANHRAGIVEFNNTLPDRQSAIEWSNTFENSVELQDSCQEIGMNGGIAVVYYFPVIEHDDNQIEVSELQNAVRSLYVPVRQANSGAVNNYDQSDLFMLVYACSSIAELMTYFERCLRLVHPEHRDMNTYDAWDKNRLSLVVGGGANANYWITNTPLIIETLNTLIRSVNSILLPIGFDITKRRQLLNQCIFGHHDKWRSEEYIFIPRVFYKYDELNSRLDAVAFDPSTVCVSTQSIINYVTQFIRPIINGTITAIMLGDMAKAYPNQVMVLGEFSREVVGDSSSLFSDDEHILMSIRNADLIGEQSINSVTDLTIQQGINATYDTYIYQGVIDTNSRCSIPLTGSNYSDSVDGDWDYEAASACSYIAAKNLYDTKQSITITRLSHFQTNSDTLDKDELMIATRFKACINYILEARNPEDDIYYLTQSGGKITQCGTEILSHIILYNYRTLGDYSANNLEDIIVRADWTYENGVSVTDNVFPTVGPFVCGRHASLAVKANNAYHYLPASAYDIVYANEGTSSSLKSHDIRSANLSIGRKAYNFIPLKPEEFKYLNIASFGSLIKPQSANETTITVATKGGRSRDRKPEEEKK